jgi:hypothetical protein
MSDRIIFDDAIEAIAARAKLAESDKKILRVQLVDAVLGNHLKVFEKGFQAPYDFNSVRGAAGLQSARFGRNDWNAVKTFEAEIYAVDLDQWLEQNWPNLKFRFGIITDTLFDSRLSEREFGSYVLHVPSLLKWAELKDGLHFPLTEPPLEKYKFVQVESLLCAIERVCLSMTNEQAFSIVQSNPELKSEKAAREPDTARWLLGADAHVKWKSQIAMAVNSRDLTLLDYPSLLPISPEALRVLLESLPYINQASASHAGNSDYKKASDKQSSTSKHTVNGNPSRDTDLTSEILKAISKALDPNSDIAVWTALRDMALDGEGLFTGLVNDEGLHYEKSSGGAATLNKSALSKRLTRLRSKGTA